MEEGELERDVEKDQFVVEEEEQCNNELIMLKQQKKQLLEFLTSRLINGSLLHNS